MERLSDNYSCRSFDGVAASGGNVSDVLSAHAAAALVPVGRVFFIYFFVMQQRSDWNLLFMDSLVDHWLFNNER